MSCWHRALGPIVLAATVLSAGVATGAPRRLSVPTGHASSTASARGAVLQTPPSIMRASARRGVKWKPGPAKYGVGSHLNLPIRGANGVVLRADVYYPTKLSSKKPAKGPFPVLLIQSPYGKSTAGSSGFAPSTGEDPYLVEHGYIDVVSDVRGTGDSLGKFGFFDPIQTRDSKKVLRWAARRPHSTHQVGTYGASYLGIDQIRLAGAVGKHSPLKAIFPVVSATDLYRDIAFMGGVLDSEFGAIYLGLTSGLNILNPIASPQNLAGLTKVEIKHLTDIYTFDAAFTAKTLTGAATAYDGHYWKRRQPNRAWRKIVRNHIPAYLIGGEYDVFQRGEPLNYAALQNLVDGRRPNTPMTPGQKVTGRYQLWDGPFTHLTGSAVNTSELELRWFDTWLKHKPTGMAKTPTPLHYYDLGTSRYHQTASYPFRGLHAKRLFLGNHDTLLRHRGKDTGTDTLVYSATGNPCGPAADQWAIGPIEAAEQIGGFQNAQCLQDNSVIHSGPVQLRYTSKPVKKARTIGGPISARIYASATTTNALWVAEIEDVNPKGKAHPLTEGALLGSLRSTVAHRNWRAPDSQLLLPYHRYTSGSARAVTPGKVTRYDLEIFPTLDTLRKGHRLRLTLTTADAPHLQTSVPASSDLIGGVYTIHRSGAKASSIEVPIGHVTGPKHR